jgi:hypothetical protein
MSAARAAGHRHISLRINFCRPRGFGEKPVCRAGRIGGIPRTAFERPLEGPAAPRWRDAGERARSSMSVTRPPAGASRRVEHRSPATTTKQAGGSRPRCPADLPRSHAAATKATRRRCRFYGTPTGNAQLARRVMIGHRAGLRRLQSLVAHASPVWKGCRRDGRWRSRSCSSLPHRHTRLLGQVISRRLAVRRPFRPRRSDIAASSFSPAARGLMLGSRAAGGNHIVGSQAPVARARPRPWSSVTHPKDGPCRRRRRPTPRGRARRFGSPRPV